MHDSGEDVSDPRACWFFHSTKVDAEHAATDRIDEELPFLLVIMMCVALCPLPYVYLSNGEQEQAMRTQSFARRYRAPLT